MIFDFNCKFTGCTWPPSNYQPYRLKGHRRTDPRTWKERRRRELYGWDVILERMADAYIEWKYVSNMSPPLDPGSDEYPYSLTVLDIFTMQQHLTIYQPRSDNPVPVNLALHGFLSKTPSVPTIAIGFRTLELFHRIRLRKASMSVEAFTRVLCDYYEVSSHFTCRHLMPRLILYQQAPFRRYFRTVLAETYEVYVRILNIVRKRVHDTLGWNTADWRVNNACKACCYVVSVSSFPEAILQSD